MRHIIGIFVPLILIFGWAVYNIHNEMEYKKNTARDLGSYMFVGGRIGYFNYKE
jgi:hypothetical protein